MEEIKLKECPCCGGESKFRAIDGVSGRPISVCARCTKCGLETKAFKVSADYCAKEEAAKVWNRRESNIETCENCGCSCIQTIQEFSFGKNQKLLKSVLSVKNSQRLKMKIVNFEIFKCKGSLLSFKRKNKDNPFCEYYGLDFDGLVLRELPEITSNNIKDIAYDLYIVILDEHKIMIKLRDAL